MVSSDITGQIYLTNLIDSYLMFRANTQAILQTRLGACYSIAPFVQVALVLPRSLLQILSSRDNQGQLLKQ